MIESLLPLDIPPGLFANGTKFQAAGRWNDGNLVRFHEGTIQPIGGWIPRATSGVAISGSVHAALSWLKADGTPLLAVGTENGLYIIDNGDVVFDITPTTGHAAPYNWQLTLFGTFLMATNTLLGDDDISATNVFVWEGDTGAAALAAFTTAEGPQGAYASFATPERFFTILRGKDPTDAPPPIGVTPDYSERRVYWASQETIDDYISTDINTGGSFDLTTDGRLIAGAAGRGQSLLWTDVDLWTMNYIGGDLIYSFVIAGSNCGIVSKRAAVVLNQGAYWMGRGKFFVYDGFVRALPCEVTDKVFGDFNESSAHTVWALANPRYNEVTWFYPSAAASSPNRYVTYNYQENHWAFGTLRRSVGVSQRFRQDIIDAPVPVMFDDAQMYDHETANERGGQSFLVSGPVQLGQGDRLMRLQGVLPDDKTAGDVQLRLFTSMAPDDVETLRGPFTLAAYSTMRATARQIRVKLEETGAVSWRVGKIRLAVRPAERRGPGKAGTIDTTPASILITPSAVTLINAQHFTFSALVLNAEGQVLDLQPTAWLSDNTDAVPIDDTGTVTAISTPATAHITATLGAITSNTATVTVAGDTTPASITITPTVVNVAATVTTTLTAVVKNAAGMILTRAIDAWFSDTTAVATAAALGDDTATLTAVADGSANVTAGITTPPLTSNVCAVTVLTQDIVHSFDTAGTFDFTVLSGSGNARTLIVAGGAGAGSVDGTGVVAGGGGGGGVIQETTHALTPQTYEVVVGREGDGTAVDAEIGVPVANGGNGANSSFDGQTAIGGGGGGAGDSPTGGDRDGADGGSGGGGGGVGGTGSGSGGAGTVGQGHDGANGSPSFPGGGGGGAGGAGSVGSGGVGITDDIDGTSRTYASGGNSTADSPGLDATDVGGGGHGGGNQRFAAGGKGKTGRVVIRYSNATGIVATGGTITTI